MIQEWVWGEIPRGFVKKTKGANNLMVVREDIEASIDFDTLPGEPLSQGSENRFRGRGSLGVLRLGNGDRALIRAYRHGGFFRFVTGRLFFTWPPRPFKELAITAEVRRRRIPTVEVYGACVRRVAGPFYHGWLITRELTDASDLWTAMESGLFQSLGAQNVLRAVAISIRNLHREGVYHGDLNLKNLLVRRESSDIKVYIIDFDKATLFLGTVPDKLAQMNLDRLLRSARKLDPTGKHFPERYWSCLLEFYRGAERNEH
jgi:3-deoxy-D-manno-octulosonic acid kinase